jgi:hypothetical protein
MNRDLPEKFNARTCSITGCDAPIKNGRGWCGPHYERWRKYGDPLISINGPRGAGTVMKKGYRRLGVGGELVLEHRQIAERVLGRPLPDGVVVHHVDENKAHNENGNLVICPDETYHRLLHRRMRARDACGHADWLKCNICKRHSPPAEIVQCAHNKHHAACMKARQAANFQARQAKLREAAR